MSGEKRKRIPAEARVLLKRPHQMDATDVGTKQVEPAPLLYSNVRFTHAGRVEIGRVERIDPADWRPGDGPPTILVVQYASE
jgi:hypothetical protein